MKCFALVPVVAAAVLGLACQAKDASLPPAPPITERWSDDFERADVGPLYTTKADDAYRISGGVLGARGGYNRPLWLRRPIPRDAVIELDAWSQSPQGDIKVEAWGDGRSYDADRGSYLATSYVFIFGGWNNSKSMIARRDEHAPGQPERSDVRVEPGRRYHWKIVRDGNRIDWFIDDMTTPFLSLEDPQPLEGPDHAHFAFNDWQADVYFDHLTITPLR